MVTPSQSKNKRKTGREANIAGNMWIPIIDRELVRIEGVGLQDYWLDCWTTDPFGSRWVLMCAGDEAAEALKSTTKAKYRKQLEEMGLFVFKSEKRGKQRALWVRNLHGSKAKSSGNQLDQIEKNLEQIEESLDGTEQTLDQIEQKFREPLGSTAFESSLISSHNLLNTYSTLKNENLSTETRSGRLELEASTKVAASAPSPAASIVEKKSFATSQDLGSSKDPESNEEDPDLFASAHELRNAEDLGSMEPSRSSSQKKRLVSTECVSAGEDNKIPLAPHAISPQSDTLPRQDAPEPALAEPTVESSTEPPQPAANPLVGVNGKSFDDIYLETRMNYSQRNLKLPLWELRLTAFERLLRAGQLRPISDWVKDEALAEDFVGDYLLIDDEYPDELLVVLAGKPRELTPWSQLPAIVFDRPQKARN